MHFWSWQDWAQVKKKMEAMNGVNLLLEDLPLWLSIHMSRLPFLTCLGSFLNKPSEECVLSSEPVLVMYIAMMNHHDQRENWGEKG